MTRAGSWRSIGTGMSPRPSPRTSPSRSSGRCRATPTVGPAGSLTHRSSPTTGRRSSTASSMTPSSLSIRSWRSGMVGRSTRRQGLSTATTRILARRSVVGHLRTRWSARPHALHAAPGPERHRRREPRRSRPRWPGASRDGRSSCGDPGRNSGRSWPAPTGPSTRWPSSRSRATRGRRASSPSPRTARFVTRRRSSSRSRT